MPFGRWPPAGFQPYAEFSIPIGCPSTTDDPATSRPTAPSQPKKFLVVFPATISKCSMTCMDLFRRQSTPQMPLADLFMSILRGEGTRVAAKPVRLFDCRHAAGRSSSRRSPQYAQRTHNWPLLHLIDRIQNPDAVPVRQQPPAPRPPQPQWSDDERDYRSVVDVWRRTVASVSMAVLGKVRRRWLERQPRDPSSRHPNRLADVLARMVADGVLVKQGTRYVPGPNYARYVGTPEPAAVA